MKRHVFAVDIGGSKIAFVAREVGGKRDVYADKVKTPAEQGVGAILRLLDKHIDKLPGGRSSLKAMGVGVPGHVALWVRSGAGQPRKSTTLCS